MHRYIKVCTMQIWAMDTEKLLGIIIGMETCNEFDYWEIQDS